MKATFIKLLPRLENILSELGENIKLARLRRKLTAEQVSERAGITRTTLRSVEKGSPSVSIACYAQVLFVLGLEMSLLQIASNDELGKKLQDAALLVKKRAPKK